MRPKRERRRERLWSKDLILAMAVNFFVALVFYALMTTLARYAVDRFAAGESAAGLAASMFIVGSTVARLGAGRLIDALGRRRVLLVCLAGFVLASGGYFLTDSLAQLYTLRFVHGTAFGIGTTAVLTIGQSLIPASRRGEGTGYFALPPTLATAVGPALALGLVDRAGYPGLFVGVASASVLALAVALGLRAPEPPHLAGVRRWSGLIDRSALPIASVAVIIGVAFSGVMTFVDSFAVERDLPGGASVFFLACAVVLGLSRLVMGRLQDVHGDNAVIYPSILASATGLALLATAQSTSTLVVAGALIGLGNGTVLAASQAIVVAAAPPHRLGVALATLFLFLDLGAGLGPVPLGAVVAAVGFGPMYAITAGVVALGAGLYHLAHGRTEHARRHRRTGEPS